MYLFLLSYLIETRLFSTGIRKIFKYQISRKSVPWEPSYFMRTEGRAEGQTVNRTDMTKLIVSFLKFANSPENT